MKKVLIADPDLDFCEALASELQNDFEVNLCHDGASALNMLRTNLPDIFVLDILLPEVDGITVLTELASHKSHPIVLVTSRFLSEYLITHLSNLSVSYIMLKPCSIKAVRSRIMELSVHTTSPQIASTSPRDQISFMLQSLGVSPKLKGYTCLKEAILLLAENPTQSITKELYPAVARRINATATASQVERLMRSAITSAWKKQDTTKWEVYFQDDIQSIRPTNHVFISRLAEAISISY